MADNEKDKVELKLNDDAGKKGKSKLLIIVAVVLLVIGGAAFFFLGKGSSDPSEEEIVVKDVYFFIPIKEPFLFTATARPKGHLVQIKLVIEVKGERNRDLATHHLPALKGAVTKYVSDVRFADIVDSKGKENFKNGILKALQSRMNSLEREPIIESVLYDGFIIQ